MKIEIHNIIPYSLRDTKFERLCVSYDAGGTRRRVESEVITPRTSPEELTNVLRGFTDRIERECLGLTVSVFARSESESESGRDWESFVADVNRIDCSIKSGELALRYDPKLPNPGPGVPDFQFFGWKVFKR